MASTQQNFFPLPPSAGVDQQSLCRTSAANWIGSGIIDCYGTLANGNVEQNIGGGSGGSPTIAPSTVQSNRATASTVASASSYEFRIAKPSAGSFAFQAIYPTLTTGKWYVEAGLQIRDTQANGMAVVGAMSANGNDGQRPNFTQALPGAGNVAFVMFGYLGTGNGGSASFLCLWILDSAGSFHVQTTTIPIDINNFKTYALTSDGLGTITALVYAADGSVQTWQTTDFTGVPAFVGWPSTFVRATSAVTQRMDFSYLYGAGPA